MDIEIPWWLRWVSYLVSGDEWPGSESGCRRDRDHLLRAAADLLDQIPDLNNVRAETVSVVVGQTAQAADEHFALLFDGDYAMDKLADGVKALGDAVGEMGDVIEGLKIEIIIGLAWAAAEMSYHLANAPWTGGASLALIPPTEAATRMTIIQLVGSAMRRIGAKLADMLSRTTIKQLLPAARRAALHEIPDELGWAISEKLTTDTVVAAAGLHPDFTLKSYGLTAVAAGAGAPAGGGTAVWTRYGLGDAHSKLGAAGKGMLTMGISGGVGSGAGALAVMPATGHFDPQSVLTGAALTSVGGVKGIGGGPPGGHTPTPARPGPPSGMGSAPPQLGPFTPQHGDFAPVAPAAAGPSVNGAEPVAGRLTVNTTNINLDPGNASQGNDVVPPRDSSAAPPAPTTTQQPGTGTHADAAMSTGPDAIQQVSTADPPSHSSEATTRSGAHPFGDGAGHDRTMGGLVSDPTQATIQNEGPAHHRAGEPDVLPAAHPGPESTIEPTIERAPADTGSVANPASHTPQNPTAPASALSPSTIPGAPAPTPSAPSTEASAPTRAPASSPSARTPQTDAPQHVRPPAAAASTAQPAGSVAARLSDTTASPARSTPRPNRAPAVNEPSSDAGIADPTPLADTPAGAETDNCLVGCFDRLADHHDRPDLRRAARRLADQVGPNGLPARLGYEAVRSRADFTTLAQTADELARMADRSSALLTWSWTDDHGRRGGHTAVLIKDGNDIYLYDPKTNQHHHYDPDTQRFTGYHAQHTIAKLAVGFLKPNGEPLRRLRWYNRIGGLAPAHAVGHVQGHPEGGDPAIPPKPGPGEPYGWMSDDESRRHVLEQRALTDATPSPRGAFGAEPDPAIASLSSTSTDAPAVGATQPSDQVAGPVAADADSSSGLLGVTDPREHGPGWRYVMVPLSTRGAMLRELLGSDSRVARSIAEDVFVRDPDRVGVDRGYDPDEDRNMSHKPHLIDADHPPEHAGLLVWIPPQHLHLTPGSRPDGTYGPITGDHLMAEEHRKGAPVYVNSTFGPGVEIIGVVIPQTQTADGTSGPISAWDAEWLQQLSTERELPIIQTPAREREAQRVELGPDGWRVVAPVNRQGEGGTYPLTGDGAFRSVETDYATGLLMYPRQLGQALEDMKTAGVSDEELRAIAADYELLIDRNEKPRLTLKPSDTNPDHYEVVGVSIRDQDWAEDSYGRYEQCTVITAEGAHTGRVHSDRWEDVVEALHPQQTAELIQEAKQHYPDLAEQIDDLYQQVRTPNAEQWAHEQRIGERIPDGVMQEAANWTGRPIDWQAAQARASHATAISWAQTLATINAGIPAEQPANAGIGAGPAQLAGSRVDRPDVDVALQLEPAEVGGDHDQPRGDQRPAADGPVAEAFGAEGVEPDSLAGERDRGDAVELDRIRELTRLLREMETVPFFAEGARNLLDSIQALTSLADGTGHLAGQVTCVDLVNARLAVLSGRPALLPADASQQVSAESGRHAVGLWIAHNAASQFVSSYDDIEARLLNDESPEQVAMVAVQWAGVGADRPGHVFMLRRIGDQVFLDDPKNGVLEPWTPQLQRQYAAAKIAVGWLDKNFQPTQHLSPHRIREGQLHAVREIGNAAGRSGPTDDPRTELEPEAARRLAFFTRQLEQAYARLEQARRDGEPSAVEAAAAEYRRVGQLRATYTSAVMRMVSWAHRVEYLADDMGIGVSTIKSVLRELRSIHRQSVDPFDCGLPVTTQDLESAQEEYRKAALEVERAQTAMDTDGSSDPDAGDAAQWPGGSPLGWAAADLAAHAETHPKEKVNLLAEALQSAVNPATGEIMAWVAKRTRGLNVGDLLVVIPGEYGSNILRVDPTSGDVSVVPLKALSKPLSAVLFRPVQPAASAASVATPTAAVHPGTTSPTSTGDTTDAGGHAGDGAGEGSHDGAGEAAAGDKDHPSIDDIIAEFREASPNNREFCQRVFQDLDSGALIDRIKSALPPDAHSHPSDHETADTSSDVGEPREEGSHSGDTLPESDPFASLADLPVFNEVREIASQSPTLVEQLQSLKADGWRFEMGWGKGTYTDPQNRIINMDPLTEMFSPGEIVHSIAHEVGHAIAEQPRIRLWSREAFIREQLTAEGDAEMNAIKVRREIVANGGADPVLEREEDDEHFQRVYDAYLEAGSTPEAYQEAIRAIGQEYSVSTMSGTTQTYYQYYRDMYDKNIRGLRWVRTLLGRNRGET